jgi:ATPase subunit of ABC transporter with duplicated ATPase domains
MDFPGADVIADRLASMNPMAQVDEKSEIPPQVQMELANSKKQLQDMQQQLQAAQLEINNRGQVQQIREEGATKRKLMEVTAKAHNTETMAEVKVNDQNTRAITSQNKTEIDAIVELLLHHMDTGRLMQEIEKRNMEQNQFAAIAAEDIGHGASPFTQQQQMQPEQMPMQQQPMEQQPMQ